jgi:multidrug efflux system outer membrane protein
LLGVALAACAVGPDYERPALAVPPTWSEASSADMGEADVQLAAWWDRFDDPRLADFVERAVRSNRELRIAEARVREARGLRGISRAGLWPQFDLTGETSPATGSTLSLFYGALDMLWEVDVFGGQRRAVEAASADIDASIEDRRAVLLTLLGEVATTYIEACGLQHRIETVRGNLAAQQETRDLTELQRRVGLASDLVVDRARAQVALTASELPPLESARAAAEHRLAVLLGEPPAALAAELAAMRAIPSAPEALVIGVPADLLRRRPDLGRAERELAAATARIGEATADLLPRFTLTGSVGLRSDDVKDLVAGQGGFASIGPNVVWPIFAAGRIRANIAVQNARQEQALANYEQTLLEALEDVETGLVRHAREQVRRRELKLAVEANRGAVELARRLYANGLAQFLDVLDAERSLLVAESLFVDSETAVSTSLVALYVALGGGWREAEELRLP